MKKGNLVQLFLLSVSILILTACGGNDNKTVDGAASGSDKEIVFWNIGTEEVDKAIYNKAIDLFNSTTTSGYKVTSVPIQNDNYKERLVIAMSL